MLTTKEVIKELTKEHLLKGNLLFCQNVTAVGWVQGSVPELTEEQGIVELPTSDVSNSGVVVGAGLAGKRPIYIVRYQGFMWYNAASLVNYAAKSKYMWGVPCPVFVRSLGMEGGMGPVAGGMHHSMIMHMPGMPVACPVTPNEWRQVWQYFLDHDDPVYCSEHRNSLNIDYEMEDKLDDEVDVTVFAISMARVSAKKAIEGEKWNLVNVVWLKPHEFSNEVLSSLSRSKFGVIVECSHSTCGAGEHLACDLMMKTGKKVHVLGLKDETAGFASHCDNTTPGPENIKEYIIKRLKHEI